MRDTQSSKAQARAVWLVVETNTRSEVCGISMVKVQSGSALQVLGKSATRLAAGTVAEFSADWHGQSDVRCISGKYASLDRENKYKLVITAVRVTAT